MSKLTKKLLTDTLFRIYPKASAGQNVAWACGASCARSSTASRGARKRELPTRGWFGRHTITWNTVCYYYNKWRQPLLCKDGSWQRMWEALLAINKAELDMSSVQLDGSHTPAWRGRASKSVGQLSGCLAVLLCNLAKAWIQLLRCINCTTLFGALPQAGGKSLP